jgi:signal transduction histidine kinase
MESLGLVGQMAASITHEIRNPMAVIKGFVQLLQEKNSGVFMNYYDIILEELNRANEIINDFLALAQNRVVEMKEAHLNDTVRTLEPMILADANLRGITLQVELQEDLPAILMNDKEMKQLLLNLSRNGLEAMSSGGLLTIRTSRQESNVQLVITDTGPGIPKEQQDKIFQPFYTTKERGTGLGLPVCYSIVKKHDGSMNIDSEMGQGTVITITLPVYVSG